VKVCSIMHGPPTTLWDLLQDGVQLHCLLTQIPVFQSPQSRGEKTPQGNERTEMDSVNEIEKRREREIDNETWRKQILLAYVN